MVRPVSIALVCVVWLAASVNLYAEESPWTALSLHTPADEPSEVTQATSWLVNPRQGSALVGEQAKATTTGDRLSLEQGRVDLDSYPQQWLVFDALGYTWRLSGSLRTKQEPERMTFCLGEDTQLELPQGVQRDNLTDTTDATRLNQAGCYQLQNKQLHESKESLPGLSLPEFQQGLGSPLAFEQVQASQRTLAQGEKGEQSSQGGTDLAPSAGEGACLESGDSSGSAGDVNSERPNVEVDKENAHVTIRVRWK